MNNIICLHNWGKNKMKYEKLITKLKDKPVENYSIQDAEILARKVLTEGYYDNIIGSTPIVKIAKEFGFECYKADNMPDDISGNIFVGGKIGRASCRERV